MRKVKVLLTYVLSMTLILLSFSNISFAVETRTVTVNLAPGISATYQVNGGPVTEYTEPIVMPRYGSIDIYFEAAYGYIFKGWSDPWSKGTGDYNDESVGGNRTINTCSERVMKTVTVDLAPGISAEFSVAGGPLESYSVPIVMPQGESIDIYFTAASGYEFLGWTDPWNSGSGDYHDGSVGNDRTVFTSSREVRTVDVVLDPGLSAVYSIDDGPDMPYSSPIVMPRYSKIEIMFSASSGYFYLGWEDPWDMGTGDYVDEVVKGDRTVYAYSSQVRDVTVEVPMGVMATINYTDPYGIPMGDVLDGFAGAVSGTYTVLYDSLFSADFVPDTLNGYVFDYWMSTITSEGQGPDGDGYYEDDHVRNNRTVTGFAHQVTYDVTAITDPLGVTAVFSGTGTGFIDGDPYTVTLDSYDDINYVFTGWLDGTLGMVNTGNIAGDHVELVAEFTDRLYTVSVEANISGTNAVFSGFGTDFLNGDPYDVQLVAFDETGFTFEGWSVSNTGNIEGADVEIVAIFEVIPPPPNTYVVRIVSNLPAGGIFSGYGTGFVDGSPYSVALVSYDDVNYNFLGFQGATSGVIAGADVEILALFEEVIPEEPIPEEPIPEEPIPEGPIPEEPIPEEPAPEPEPEEEPLEEFIDEETPEELPETGGIAAQFFYGLGAFLSVVGSFLRRRK